MAPDNCRSAPREMDVDVIDGSLESASPCPSENKLWLQGTLILEVYQRSCHTSLPNSGVMGRDYHLLC